MNALNKIKLITNVSQNFVRNYAFKSDLKIKWVRPAKIACTKPEKSGDLVKLEPIDSSKLLYDFRNSKELSNADGTVRSMFMLENNRRKETILHARMQMIDKVKRHDLDFGSMESKLADMTVKIRASQEYLEKFPRNRVVFVQLKEMIDKRKRFLRYLRRWDYKRFEWVLEKLDIVYKPYPTKFHWITRKDSLRQLTDIHCNNIKEQRLLEYRQILESQQLEFLENKIKNLEFIRNEQIECKVPVTVKNEEIQEVRKQLTELKNKRGIAHNQK